LMQGISQTTPNNPGDTTYALQERSGLGTDLDRNKYVMVL
jgi:hypothetical protein